MKDISNFEERGIEIKALLLDDDEDDFIIINDMLEDLGNAMKIDIRWESDYNTALEAICNEEYDICLVDYRLGEHTGLQFIKAVRDKSSQLPLILLTGQGDSEIDFEAMKLGASDYLVKGDFEASMLGRSIRYAINHSKSVRELNANEEKYRSLFERSVDALYITNKEHLFIDVNPSLEKLLNYDKQELLNMSMKEIFKNKQDYDHLREKLLKNGQIKDFEARLCTKDKKELDCIINSITLKDENDHVYAYQGIIHDRTLRKRAEKQLLVAEKLAMTGQIARSIAHEVRNPLTNLNLALEQLRDEVVENDEAEMYLEIIKRNASRVDQLITDMLQSSKPRTLDKKPIGLNEVIEKTLQVTADRIKLRGIKLEKELASDLPQLNADIEQLNTAFLNIVINAIEAMPENDGKLVIKTMQSDDYLILEINDNGKGIPEEEINKLFNPFFTSKKSGMGLGLTSTQNILNSHNAQVDVESEIGEGTTFRIFFNIENQN